MAIDEIEIEGQSKLPLELEIEILSYLPVKSLLRFTCVCKSWLHLIKNDRQFALKHYATRATSSSRVLDSVDCMLESGRANRKCMYSFTQAKTFRILKKFDIIPSDDEQPLRVHNSCHGIICFDMLSCGILLCNPSIREVVFLPPPPNYGRLTLGFDPVNNDYKVVSIYETSCYDSRPWDVKVISAVRSGQWRNVHANVIPNFKHFNYNRSASNANGRICNWLADKQITETRSSVQILVSFDMVEEVLKEIPMPQCEGIHHHKLLSTSRWVACLACFPVHGTSAGFIDVWVCRSRSNADDLTDCEWSKDIVVKFPGHEPVQPVNFWFNDRELLVAIQKGKLNEVFHYNIVTQQLTRTGRNGAPHYICVGYVETLVSIKQLVSPEIGRLGEHIKCNDDAGGNAIKDEGTGEFIFREVGRKGVRWSCKLHKFQADTTTSLS